MGPAMGLTRVSAVARLRFLDRAFSQGLKYPVRLWKLKVVEERVRLALESADNVGILGAGNAMGVGRRVALVVASMFCLVSITLPCLLESCSLEYPW
jgi:hypothetical protein